MRKGAQKSLAMSTTWNGREGDIVQRQGLPCKVDDVAAACRRHVDDIAPRMANVAGDVDDMEWGAGRHRKEAWLANVASDVDDMGREEERRWLGTPKSR